jgi:hypothetical protein
MDGNSGIGLMLSPTMVFLIALSVVLVAILLILSKLLRTVIAMIRSELMPVEKRERY